MRKHTWEIFRGNPGMILVPSFFLLFASSSLALLAANALFPSNVVLGTMSLSPGWAVALSMGTLSTFLTLAIPFSDVLEKWKGGLLTPLDWMLNYFLLNAALLWLISRASDVFGLGISSWYVVAALAMAFDVAQTVVMVGLEKVRKM